MPARAALIAGATGHATMVTEPGGDYDVVFDLSGSASGLELACSQTKCGGRLCTMSHLDGYSSAEFLLSALTRRDITFTVSYLNGERCSLEIAADLLACYWNDGWERVVETVSIEELQDAFATRRRVPWCKTLIEVSPLAG